MKKLFLISIFFFICGWGAHSQDSTASATISILPPADAVEGEIYCYCVEYYRAKDSGKDSTYKYVYVTPSMNRKGQYIETSCFISGLIVGDFMYIFNVYVLYCGCGYYGCGGNGMRKQGLGLFTKHGKNEYLFTLYCGLIDYTKYKGPCGVEL